MEGGKQPENERKRTGQDFADPNEPIQTMFVYCALAGSMFAQARALPGNLFIPFCLPCHGRAKTSLRLARRVAVVQDANSAVAQIAARDARSSREMLRHAANVPG